MDHLTIFSEADEIFLAERKSIRVKAVLAANKTIRKAKKEISILESLLEEANTTGNFYALVERVITPQLAEDYE